jgi:hypothetical protein
LSRPFCQAKSLVLVTLVLVTLIHLGLVTLIHLGLVTLILVTLILVILCAHYRNHRCHYKEDHERNAQ